MVVGRIIGSGAALMVALSCAACSSHQAGSSVASSPARAAIGFDVAETAQPPTAFKFSCPDSRGVENLFPVVLRGPRIASTVRVGERWQVTVREAGTAPGAPANTYDVRRKDHGYCVVGPVSSNIFH